MGGREGGGRGGGRGRGRGRGRDRVHGYDHSHSAHSSSESDLAYDHSWKSDLEKNTTVHLPVSGPGTGTGTVTPVYYPSPGTRLGGRHSPLVWSIAFRARRWLWTGRKILRRLGTRPTAMTSPMVWLLLAPLVTLVILAFIFFIATPPEWRKVKRKISLWHPLTYQAPTQIVASLHLGTGATLAGADQPSLSRFGRTSRTIYLVLAHDVVTVAGVEDMLGAMWFDQGNKLDRANDSAWASEDANVRQRDRRGDLFLVHIDARSSDTVAEPLEKWTRLKRHRVVVLPREFRKSSAWGGFGLVDAQLSLIQAAAYYAPLHFGREDAGLGSGSGTFFDYAVLIDGAAFPLTSRRERQELLQNLPLHVNVFNMESFSPYYISRIPWLGPTIDCLGPEHCRTFSNTPGNGVIVKHDQWAVLSGPTVTFLNDAMNGIRQRGALPGTALPGDTDLRAASGGDPAAVDYVYAWLQFFRKTKIWATDEAVLGSLIYNAAPSGTTTGGAGAALDDLGGRSRLGPQAILNSPSLIFTKWGHTCKTYVNLRVPFSPCYLGLQDLPELLNATSQSNAGRDWRESIWYDGRAIPALHMLRAVKSTLGRFPTALIGGRFRAGVAAGPPRLESEAAPTKTERPPLLVIDPTTTARTTSEAVYKLPIDHAVALFARKFRPADPVKAVLELGFT